MLAMSLRMICSRITSAPFLLRSVNAAEIAAALALAGELSLGAAAKIDRETRTNEWVDAHERLGRNR